MRRRGVWKAENHQALLIAAAVLGVALGCVLGVSLMIVFGFFYRGLLH